MQSNSTLAQNWNAYSFKKVFQLILLSFFFSGILSAQQIAFPGAEGAGRFSTGGRGTSSVLTSVFEVTNLNDDNNPGSLRYALQASQSTYAYKTVVFRISGTIHLLSALSIKSNVTIAGQTAPGDGICMADYPVSISGDNIIVRYMRFRLGDKNQLASLGNDDAFSGTGHKNVIIDHCSMSWSDDEAFTVYSGDSTTLQWNLIAEPLNFSYHDEGTGVQNHGYGGIQGGKLVSIHHNLFAHCLSRTPRFDGVRNLAPNTAGLENVDFVNNVIYDWGSNNIYGGEGGNYNLVNNYFKYGPSTNATVKYRIVNPYKQTTAPVIAYGKFYLSGNYVDGSTANTANNWLGVTMEGGLGTDTSLSKVTTPFTIAPLTTQVAASAYNFVLQKAGANLPARDTLDQRIINDVQYRTGKLIDVQGGYAHGTAYASTTGAWPTLNSVAAPADGDHDGMPDAYENANGLNASNAADRGLIAANGYTNLENYLNSLTTQAAITVSGNLTGFAQTVGSPSVAKTYNVTGSNLTGNVTVTPPANYQVSSDGNTWFSNATPLSLSPLSGNISATVSVRLNAAAAGNYSGNIVNATSGASSQNMAVSGITATAPAGVNVVVAKDGTGNYTTVQAAIDNAPTGLTAPYIIFIKNGKYREKITVPSTKPFIQLIGESVANTILYYDDPATVLGTQNSASFTISANDFSAMNITFSNTYGDGSQAVALLVNADRAVFKNCRFLGNQDTLYTKGSGTPRQYFRNCYIDGNVDFIFGSSVAVFDSCVIYPKSRTTSGSSFITAANTTAGQTYGYVFRNSRIASNTGATTYYLGRPWQNSTGASPFANNKTVYLNTTMGNSVRSEGWVTWDAGTNTSLIYYGEYQSKDFAGANVAVSGRPSWSYQLTSTEAASYSNSNLFGTWDPCAVSSSICTYQPQEIAVSNFRASKGITSATLDWNISWAMTGIKYELYRSSAQSSGYAKIGELIAANDTAYNFQMNDVLPAPGNAYYYYVVASKTGSASNTTDTLSISSVPTITETGALSAFTQNLGTPSASQTFTVSGDNLLDNITITPPVSYEVSLNGINWFTNTTPLVLTQTNNTVASTNISVRLNGVSLGTSSGNIVLSSSGATSVNVPVTGTTAIIPPSTSTLLQEWPMTLSNADSAGVRSPGVTASTPTFNKLVVANGTTVVNTTTGEIMPPYSFKYGQAFGATSAGLWSTAGGGPGGNLNRTFYEQFTVTATTGYSDRIDSVTLYSAFYNSNSSTKLAVVYSLSNFVSDSANVTGGTGPLGTLLAAANGGFTTPVALNNQTAGTTDNYRFALNGLTGITLSAGQTLTIRMYFSCSSSSTGRYGLVRDVTAIGKATDLSAPVPTITTTGTLAPFNQILGIPSAAQTYTVSAVNLSGSLIIVAPTNFEISSNGGATWQNSSTPIILAPVSGSVAATTISVRLNATAAGSSSGNIQHISGGATTVNVAVSGTTTVTPYISVTGALNNFSQTIGSPSATQTYTVTGINLTGNVTITPPAGYQVSSDGGLTWFTNASPLTLTQTGGNVAATTITVRLNAATAGNYSGNIIHASSGATSVNIAVNGIASAAPTLAVSGTLIPFAQTIGAPSAVQNYTVSGSALTGNVTITPPANYQVSADGGVTWFTSASPLILTPVSGSLVNTTISVRLNASVPGNYSGNISNTSAGATTLNVPVSGTAVPAPVITVTGTLNNFSQTVGTPSTVQTYTIAGSNLTGAVTITPPANYQVSSDGGVTWLSSLVLTPTAGTLAATTISVRLNATAAGSYTGNITNSTSGASTINVAVNGTAVLPPSLTVTGTLNAFAQTIGAPSAVQTYTVAGVNLTGNVTVTAPAGYEISSNGGTTWFNSTTPIVLTQTGGTLAVTTISVRLNAAAPGTYSGNITHVSAGATTVNKAVTGTVVPAPVLTVSGTPATTFYQYLGTPSAAQSYTITGINLVGNITVTPPARYQLSVDGGLTWTSGPVTLIPVNGSGTSTISVRLNSGFVGTYSGDILQVTSGTSSVLVHVTGITSTTNAFQIYPVPAYNVIFFAHPQRQEQAAVIIYNMSGQKLATYYTSPGAQQLRIDISKMMSGIYLLQYHSIEGEVTLQFEKR